MPASSAEVIGAALQSAFQHKPADTAPSSLRDKNNFENQLVASSKQVLLNHVEYDRVGTQQSMVLTSLKTKYVNLTASATTTPDSPPGSMAHAQHHKQSSAAKEDQLDDPKVVLWSREKVTLGWRKTFPPGAGMVNLGNTCYMNSSLQALFHIPAMANWLLDDLANHTQRCETNSTNASYCSVCAMMRTLRLSLDRSNNVIKPSLIHHKLKSIGKTLMYGRQEDAHEFIKLLLDHMEKSYLSFRRATKLDHRSKETTPLNQIFGGYIRQQVICPLCRHVSTTFSHFQDLVLDIRSVNSVDEALNLHFRKETLDADNAYKCERCHKKVPATKRHLIERAPHVLLIQLKRFTHSGGKISKHISIQKTIDISRFVNGVQKQGGAGSGPYQYRLSSMVIHIGGSQHGGHYTAVAESSSGTMFEFDDSSVRSISVQNALLRNPYILFYEMVRKPKDPAAIKQVVRQSSEKTLIRQNSDGITKPLPTSHSASSVTNGYGRVSDLGEAVTKNGHQGPNKPPLPTHKERERISFGLKVNQGNAKGDSTSKPNKIILKPGTTSLLGTKSSTSAASLFSSKPSVSSLSNSSSPSTTPSKNSAAQKPLSSLVPYLDDSEESESDDSKRGPMNGHKEKPLHNGKAKGDDHQKNIKENGVKMNGCLHNKHLEKSANSDSKNSKNNDNDNGAKSSISSSKAPFLPRSLQVITSANQLHTNGENSKGKGDIGWTVSDAALHSPSESSNSSAGGSHTASFTVVDQPTSTKNEQIKHQPQELEKLQHQGWTVTVRHQRPELEKSHSHDSVLPGPSRKKDEPDSASLRSKASVDSTRSDRSTKSMKKSIFSLFTCVTSARSPDSPEDDQPEALPPHSETPQIQQGNKSKHPEGQAKLAEPEEDLSNDNTVSHNPGKCKSSATSCKQNGLENGHSSGKGDTDNEADLPQSKRFRDRDDNEPSSPSKKCRPEDKVKLNKKNESDPAKNGSASSASKNGLSNGYDKSKNVQCNESDHSKNGVTHESAKAKNGYADGGEKENSKSVKSKKQGKSATGKSGEGTKGTVDSSSSASASSLTGSSDSESSEGEEDKEGTEHWVEKTKETIGKAKLNPNVHIVHWNGTLKDLSHTLKSEREKEGPKEFEKRKSAMWDGSRDTDVVDELRKAGNFAFGTKVNSWGGERGVIDQEFDKDRKEAKKRTADDLYNEEFDKGRVKKVKKSKKSWEDNQRWDRKAGNAFQKMQDYRNSGSWTPHNNYQNQYSNGNQHFNSHYPRDQYWDRNRDRGHHQRYNNNKPWKFHKREHKFHKKHKEKYKHWDRRD